MHKIIVLIFLSMLVVAGCSGGGTLVTPGPIDNQPIIGMTTNEDGSYSGIGLMGAYELSVDPSAMTADLVSKRLPSLGESWIVSGGAYFTIKPCTSCFKITSISMDASKNMVLEFQLKHPFAAGDPSKPPTAVNRLDLDLFDVALVFAPIDAVVTNYPLLSQKAYTGGYLMNASGFTTELANVTGDHAAMPYLLAVDDSISGINTFNKFAMGSEATLQAIIKTASCIWTHYNFNLYLTMGYGKSAANKSERLTPTYFNPEFNRKGAWKVSVTSPNGSNPPALGNTWQDNNATAPFIVTVKVWDWQQGATVENPLVNPGNVAKASNVTSVSIEIPNMNFTAPTVTAPESGTGTPSDPLVYKIPISNQNLIPAGKYRSLVKITDSRVPDATLTNSDYLIHTPNGTTLEKYAIPDFATYHCFQATVVAGGPITGKVNSPTCPVTDQLNGALINFKVTATSTAGPPITKYEVDYDYNGITFTPDFTNTTGIFNNVGPFTVPDGEYIPRSFIVAFRATDNAVPPNVTIFTSCEVIVTHGVQQ